MSGYSPKNGLPSKVLYKSSYLHYITAHHITLLGFNPAIAGSNLLSGFRVKTLYK